MIGSTLDGKYQINKLLGEGAMGSVYEAEHTGTGRRCAIKVISSADLTRDPKVVGRFQREARAAGAIDTQHITQVLDAGVDRETNLPFLAMEYLAGEDVHQLVKRVGPLAPEAGLRIVAQACLGLQKAHEASVVHRDIKPHNLFLARRDAGEVIVKLLDFGIAKVKMDRVNDTESADLTRTGNLIGSPLYMSPEQARGQRDIDHRTDLWSLGAVLYQVFTGRTPYHHINALGQLIIAICSEPPPPVQAFSPWVPPEAAALVHRCLQQDPGLRFQSAGEMFHAIRQLLPYGWGIHVDMLVGLPEGVRQQVAPHLSQSGQQAASQSGAYVALAASPASGSGRYPAAGTLGSSASLATQSGAYRALAPSGIHVGAATTGALANSQPIAPSSSSRAPVAIGAAVLALAIAGGVYVSTRASAPAQPGASGQPAPAGTTEPAVAASVPAPTPVASIAAAPEVTTNPDKRSKRVMVVILPSDALVEVEGVRTVTRDGLLDIDGIPGSVHRVRIFKGTKETLADVVVTETGALPPKVELGVVPLKVSPVKSAAGSAPSPPIPRGMIHDTGEFGK